MAGLGKLDASRTRIFFIWALWLSGMAGFLALMHSDAVMKSRHRSALRET
jgi:hypothetical protein